MPATLVLAFVIASLIVLITIVVSDIVTLSFTHLGLSPWATFLIFTASGTGSLVNIPIYRSVKVAAPTLRHYSIPGSIFHYVSPRTVDQVVAINVGGALIPILLSLWLLPRAPLLRTLLATAVVALVAHQTATLVPHRGIQMPVLVAPLLAALLALTLTRGYGAAPVAYIAGAMGILIGADLANLGRLSELDSGVLSIGGAGVFDGVFLSGLIAALFSFDRPRRARVTTPLPTV